MQLSHETSEKNTILSYDEHSFTIDGIIYHDNRLITAEQCIACPEITALTDISPYDLLDRLTQKPNILLIGHTEKQSLLSPEKLFMFSREKIGCECMSLGAACRTFNILLNEKRSVALLILLAQKS